MAVPTPKADRADALLSKLTGRNRPLAVAADKCVSCGQPATQFRDALSKKEFGLSGLCQHCQDQTFDEGVMGNARKVVREELFHVLTEWAR